MLEKKCNCCEMIKNLSEFYKNKNYKSGIQSKCKECVKVYRLKNKQKIKNYNRNYIKDNKSYYANYRKENQKNLIEKREVKKHQKKEYNKKYYIENREKIKSQVKEYSISNTNIINSRYRLRYKRDMVFKLKEVLRSNIVQSFKGKKLNKSSKTISILGCTYQEFYKYMQEKFQPWMNESNYGKYNGEYNYGWDLDHIIPISSAKTEEELIKLNHYTNFQPLCSKINRDEKRDKVCQ